uniref:Uncharacterized protein n=1 Tax=Anopheles coluzzii TaxID=1518534 RepID=A0A8W7P6X0_ANOCL
MAPGSSNNQNNNRQTGTKPKSKASKKNAVPQEIVAPTRRDQLQQQLNVLVDWATVSGASSVVQNNNTQQQPQQQHFSGAQHPPTSGQQQQHQQQSQGQNVLLKPRNNRTPGEGTCYEIDNLSLQDNSRYIPVRPIVRRNLLNESASGEQNEPHNTAVGVVIPTTPNSALQQTFRLNEGASASGSGGPIGSTHSVNNLLHSGASAGHSASGAERWPSAPIGASISTNQSTTPVPPSASCDELRYRMETQSKNMQALKEQQAHLLRLQQAARQQLQEMESIRHMHSASVAPPIESFQTVEQVQDGIGSIMERMRVLSTFIQNQQELSNMLGPEHDADVMADQVILQQKFAELRDKKSQMHNLVSELQNLNMDANRQFDGEAAAVPAEPRNVPIELTHAPAPASDARNATKIFLNGGGSTMEGTSGGLNPVATVEGMSVPAHRQLGEEQRANGHMASSAAVDEEDDEGQLNEEEASVLNGTADMLSEKINEINAMKSQLRRLKEMMDTVKLIEMKTGHDEN